MSGNGRTRVRKRRFGACVEVGLDSLKDILFPPQGLNVTVRPDVPEGCTIRDLEYDPSREVVRVYLTSNETYREMGGRLPIYELCQAQQPPNVDNWYDLIPINEDTTETAFREMLKHPTLGPKLRMLAKATLSIMLSPENG